MKLRKITLAFLSALLLLLSFAITLSALTHVKKDEGAYDGLSFQYYSAKSKLYGEESYETLKHLDAVPHTYESWVYLEYGNRGKALGTIIGNHGKSGGSFSFGINKNLYPELLLYNASDGKSTPTHKAVFNMAYVPYESWTHVVITIDEVAGKLKCYLNGSLAQTIKAADTCKDSCDDGCVGLMRLEWASKFPFSLGGSRAPMNPDFFKGFLQDTALYSDVLTEEEVLGNYENGINAYDENLICYYDVDSSDKGKDIKDASGNGYDLYYSKLWLTEEEMQEIREEKNFSNDYAYSIAVIGDPQFLTRLHPDSLRGMYSWVAANKDAKNIQYVIGLGDITDQCQESEWATAAEALKILENAGIEYSFVRGNHDVGNGVESENKPTISPDMFHTYFSNNEFYMSQFELYGGFYEEGSAVNTYRTLSFEGDAWLIVNLDWKADENVRAWAGEVIKAHPNHRTIIVTHDYISAHGTQSAYGKILWEEVASKYENVELVLSGHSTCDNINVYQTKGENGNTVTQMLIDAQYMDLYQYAGGNGVVTMLYFREDGSVIDVEHYSTTRDRYLKNINQLTIDLDAECESAPKAWDGTTSIAPKGDGSQENPYQISSAANLLWMAEQYYSKDESGSILPNENFDNFKGKYFKQVCDINLYSKTLFCIGFSYEAESAYAFCGNYDGAGYCIRNGRIKTPYENGASGLFGATDGAYVSSITLKEIILTASENSGFISGIAVSSTFDGIYIDDSCRIELTENQNSAINAGGIAGKCLDTNIVDCSAFADLRAVSSNAKVGGFAGAMNGGLIYSSESGVKASAGYAFVGEISSCVSFAECKNKTELLEYASANGAQVHVLSSFTKSSEKQHTATCECGYTTTLPHLMNDEGYCTYCGVNITGASLSLGKEISIKYYVSIYDSSIIQNRTPIMEFTFNGKKTTIDGYTTVGGELVFELGGIHPYEIGDIIDARLMLKDTSGNLEFIASKYGYSVKEYCLALLETTENSELKTLVSSLLIYGAKAQGYLDYKTDRFITGGITVSSSGATPDETYKTVVSANGNTDCMIVSEAKLAFDSGLKVLIKLKIADTSKLKITVNGKMRDTNYLIPTDDGCFNLVITDFSPTTINENISVRLCYDKEIAAAIDYRIGSTLYKLITDKQEIAEDEANSVAPQKTVNEEEYQVILALYRYGVAAEEYAKEN